MNKKGPKSTLMESHLLSYKPVSLWTPMSWRTDTLMSFLEVGTWSGSFPIVLQLISQQPTRASANQLKDFRTSPPVSLKLWWSSSLKVDLFSWSTEISPWLLILEDSSQQSISCVWWSSCFSTKLKFLWTIYLWLFLHNFGSVESEFSARQGERGRPHRRFM